MKVYIVVSGIENEGSYIETVHQTLQGARQRAKELMHQEDPESTWNEAREDFWSLGSKYYSVDAFDVLD